MFRQTGVAYLVLVISVAFCNCTGETAQDTITVRLGAPIRYGSDDGHTFEARYGSLSDNTLHFVKVTLPDGAEYTLPQVISASGVRYTDERELVWWTHQGTVRVDFRDDTGSWITKYPELHEIPTQN